MDPCDEPVFKTLKRQVASEVVNFSSQYGADRSRSYTVHNVVGESTIYPSYGDFTQTLVFRTYGTWWNQCPSTPNRFKKYTNSSFSSQDFVDIQFNDAVYPTEIEIFETYNPGAVVRILACNSDTEITDIYNRWFTLWTGNAQICKREARVFTPKLKMCPFKTRRVRLEFNQNHCEYYTEIDAVYLHGVDSKEEYCCDEREDSVDRLNNIFAKQITVKSIQDQTRHFKQDSWNILMLPVEVINKIFSYLTFTDFGNLSRCCRSFRDYCYDPLWYKEFDLQPYWQKVNKFTLHHLTERCRSTEKLRLSWCGSNDMLSSLDFTSFLQSVSGRIKCLYLSCCRFVDQNAVILIAKVCPQLEGNVCVTCRVQDTKLPNGIPCIDKHSVIIGSEFLYVLSQLVKTKEYMVLSKLDLSSCVDIPTEAFDELSKLTSLTRLNLYRTQINESGFEKITRSCTELMHINLGGCFQCHNFDEAMKHLKHCPNLVSLDLWRAQSLTSNGIISIFESCPNLEEIDLGWCKNVATHGALRLLVTHCPKIKKIFLTALRTVSDDDLIAIFKNCRFLEQLDILGNSNISKKCAEMVLQECKYLKFFDVSFCSALDDEWYRLAKERYPHVDIKKSVQYS